MGKSLPKITADTNAKMTVDKNAKSDEVSVAGIKSIPSETCDDASSSSANQIFCLTTCFLGCRPLQVISKISLSVYLLHWPLFVIVTVLSQGWDTPMFINDDSGMIPAFYGLMNYEVATATSFVLVISWLTYFYVEAPCRYKIIDLYSKRSKRVDFE